MQEDVKHLLCGVVDGSCVDPTMNPLITGAPLAVSALAQQCLYTCYAVSSNHAVIGDKSSNFWRVLRYVERVRDKYVESETLPPPPPLRLRNSCTYETTGGDNSAAAGACGSEIGGIGGVVFKVAPSCSDLETSDQSFHYSPLAPFKQGRVRKQLLPPLEFRVVVVGGGRVGRAIVELLLRVRELVHPSRVTIVTQRPEAVACFAAQGVQCVAKDAGRQALMQCHVLIIACQQSQFHDFAKIYCPRCSLTPASVGLVDNEAAGGSRTDDVDEVGGAVKDRRRPRKRTLRDVVEKWRTMETSERGSSRKNVKDSPGESSRKDEPLTRLLRPDAIVFSCCVALPAHKIASDLGHLYPLVVCARINLKSVRGLAQDIQTVKAVLHDDYVKRLQSEGNTFLTRLTLIQQSAKGGGKQAELLRLVKAAHERHGDLTSSNLSGGMGNTLESLPCLGLGDSFARMDSTNPLQSRQSKGGGVLDLKNMLPTTNNENPMFVVHMWRALRSLSVVQALNFTRTDQRSFIYLGSMGPLLACTLVALPTNTQRAIVSGIETYLDDSFRYYQNRVATDGVNDDDIAPFILLRVNQRHVPAFDSDDDEDEGCGSSSPTEETLTPAQPFLERELRRLVARFPTVFKSTKIVLQQLLSVYKMVACSANSP